MLAEEMFNIVRNLFTKNPKVISEVKLMTFANHVCAYAENLDANKDGYVSFREILFGVLKLLVKTWEDKE